jgi:hypothetical protein
MIESVIPSVFPRLPKRSASGSATMTPMMHENGHAS